MPEGSEQAPVVVPVHPLEGGEFHRLAVTPRAAPGDELVRIPVKVITESGAK